MAWIGLYQASSSWWDATIIRGVACRELYSPIHNYWFVFFTLYLDNNTKYRFSVLCSVLFSDLHLFYYSLASNAGAASSLFLTHFIYLSLLYWLLRDPSINELSISTRFMTWRLQSIAALKPSLTFLRSFIQSLGYKELVCWCGWSIWLFIPRNIRAGFGWLLMLCAAYRFRYSHQMMTIAKLLYLSHCRSSQDLPRFNLKVHKQPVLRPYWSGKLVFNRELSSQVANTNLRARQRNSMRVWTDFKHKVPDRSSGWCRSESKPFSPSSRSSLSKSLLSAGINLPVYLKRV